MGRPILMAVVDRRDVLESLRQALAHRYGADYEVIAETSAASCLQILERLRREASSVAIVIAAHWMPQMTGVDLLARVHQLHRSARRMLLVSVFDRTVNDPMSQAMALGRLDGWLLEPWDPAEEHLYVPVSEQLAEWMRVTDQPGFAAVEVVGESRSARSHEISDLLDRNAIPYRFHSQDSGTGQQILRDVEQDPAQLPILIFFDGKVLVDPTNSEVAAAIGVPTRPSHDQYDLIVVGTGPAGLSAATYGASEGLHTLMVESEALGGQAGTSSLIRNYLGFPNGISGRVLAYRASQQATLFGAHFVYASAIGLRRTGDGLTVTLAGGSEPVARAVVLATGATYRLLEAPGIDDLLGAGVFYGAAASEAPAMSGRQVYVVGGGNSAGQAAIHFAKYAAHVTVVVRSESLTHSMSTYLITEINGNDIIDVRLGTQVVAAHGTGQLEHLTLRQAESRTIDVVADALFVLIGAEPRTEWLRGTVACDQHGFVLTGHDLSRSADNAPSSINRARLLLETSVPGVFAAGDLRHGSVKRVASAVGEGANAIQLVHQHLARLPT